MCNWVIGIIISYTILTNPVSYILAYGISINNCIVFINIYIYIENEYLYFEGKMKIFVFFENNINMP